MNITAGPTTRDLPAARMTVIQRASGRTYIFVCSSDGIIPVCRLNFSLLHLIASVYPILHGNFQKIFVHFATGDYLDFDNRMGETGFNGGGNF
jgi:hypothetical protein